MTQKLVESKKAIGMVSDDLEELPLTIKFARQLMEGFFIKNKLVRDTIVYQCLLYLTYSLEIMKTEANRKATSDGNSQAGKIRVGIVGAGVMGKTLFELLHKRTLMGIPD